MDSILRDFIREVRLHPNTTAFKVEEQIVTYAQFVQRIAPIMNELDTMPDSRVALLMEDNLSIYAAMVACVLCGKPFVPVRPCWTEAQQSDALRHAEVFEMLTSQRMQYYYWMTVEDAIDRIDNGLIHIDAEQIVALQYDFSPQNELCCTPVSARQLRSLNVVKYPFL